MRRLETQADGRHFAVEVLRRLRREGAEACRANQPPPFVHQADALIKALAELKERGTVEACAGFGAILTDALGTRTTEPMPELYEGMERAGKIRPYKLRRLVGDGHRIAALAVARQAKADNVGSGERMPSKAEPPP